MAREIERKFLVRTLPPKWNKKEHEFLEQGYIAIDPSAFEVRLRFSHDQYLLTVKSGGRMTREEFEIELQASQFEALWPATEGRRLRKTRYYLSGGKPIITLDIYEGRFEGLRIAEVEFDSPEAAGVYMPEKWMGKEVTGQSFLKNRNLLDIDNFEDIARMLDL